MSQTKEVKDLQITEKGIVIIALFKWYLVPQMSTMISPVAEGINQAKMQLEMSGDGVDFK